MSCSSDYQLPVGCAFSHCPLLGLFWHVPGLEPLLAQLGSPLLPDLYQNKAHLQLPCRTIMFFDSKSSMHFHKAKKFTVLYDALSQKNV